MTRCLFIPPYLLEKIATSHPDPGASRCGAQTLRIDASLRVARATASPGARPAAGATAGRPFSVHTARHGTDLPGDLVRAPGDPASGDPAVDEAYAGVEASLALFSEVFGRDSYDDRGAEVVATVHYEQDYDNAFWDGTQLVFGDGDGTVFGRFTKPVDVLGHELSHAVTQFTADLTYEGQSGALNESVSDVFGSCLKQRLLGQTADEADWLIGEGIFLPSVQGRALRSMAEPGTAYDDPVLGKDPQVASMDDYVDTQDDNGGVHTNSGIPNKAFHLAATAIGGKAWEGAGRIWYAALTSGIAADTDFAGFADATVTAAGAVSPAVAEQVRAAWTAVGVTGAAGTSAPPVPAGERRVAVVRSGGFAGVRQAGELTLGDDPRTPEVESLLGRIDLQGLAPHRPQPDRFVYSFEVDGERVVVGEQDLTPDLDQLARILLG
ncbi:M4 family metallopeptidase [Nocardioides panacis]|uniref:M4 family metallopeptidase n=1 Tax=Nocardioides panacis TaxID=2849501 RepID=A0A975SY94_9ACTN|nr:protealysin inhibitor emfourin [Nocardioides panacis]QWZ08147.1 M4 family metallopeptidase [Nocardioides panacis]